MNEFDEFKDDSKDLFSSSDNVKGIFLDSVAQIDSLYVH